MTTINLTIAASLNNYDIYVQAGSPAGIVDVTVTVNAGVVVGSGSSLPAMYQSGSFAAGSTVTIINNGTIAGHAGDGGDGGTAPGPTNGHAGKPGKTGLRLGQNTTLVNNGTIAGGGGGGGGGAAVGSSGNGGGGGGGKGQDGGTRGLKGGGTAANGTNGSVTNPGGGGAGQGLGGDGGQGGGFGSAGSDGQNAGTATGGSGGAKGTDIDLNGFTLVSNNVVTLPLASMTLTGLTPTFNVGGGMTLPLATLTLNAFAPAAMGAVSTASATGQTTLARLSKLPFNEGIPDSIWNWLKKVDSWIRTRLTGVYSVMTYGAKGDGVTDDTNAFQAAHDAMGTTGGTLYVPAGTYNIASTITLTNPVVMRGDGSGASFLRTSSATADVLVLNGIDQRVTDIGFLPAVTRSAGAFIHCQSSASRIVLDHLVMHDWFYGIQWDGAAGLDIDSCTIFNGVATTGIGIYFSGSLTAGTIRRLFIDNLSGSKPAAGIKILQCGDLTITDSQLVHCVNGLLASPGSGQLVANLVCVNVYFDNCGSFGAELLSSATGNITGTVFTNCWASSAGASGIRINAGSGNINGTRIEGLRALQNTVRGIFISGTGTLNTQITGGFFAANGSDGIFTGVAVTDFQIFGVRSGPVTLSASGTVLAGNTGWGINISDTGSNNYQILGTDTRGNTAGGIQNNGTGATQIVANNI